MNYQEKLSVLEQAKEEYTNKVFELFEQLLIEELVLHEKAYLFEKHSDSEGYYNRFVFFHETFPFDLQLHKQFEYLYEMASECAEDMIKEEKINNGVF